MPSQNLKYQKFRIFFILFFDIKTSQNSTRSFLFYTTLQGNHNLYEREKVQYCPSGIPLKCDPFGNEKTFKKILFPVPSPFKS